MSCPHGNGNPKLCSQCLGVVPTKVVQVGDGKWMVGKKLIDRTKPAKDANYGSVLLKSNSRCTYCRKAGHTEAGCRDKYNSEALAAAYLAKSELTGITDTKKAG